jgi:hypothetical protein
MRRYLRRKCPRKRRMDATNPMTIACHGSTSWQLAVMETKL